MFHSVYSQIAFVALFGCCGLALWKGGPAEKGGAILLLVTWLAPMIELATAKTYILAGPFMLSDVVMAAGLLILAIRYSSLWMGAAMLVQAIVLSLHAGYFGADRADRSPHVLHLYVLGKNLASASLLIIILGATVTSIVQRNLARRRQAARSNAAANDVWLKA
jgi:hypothetical protein